MRLLPSSKLGLGSEWICHQLPDKANGSRVVTVRVVCLTLTWVMWLISDQSRLWSLRVLVLNLGLEQSS